MIYGTGKQLSDSVELSIQNPWVGPDSAFKVHQDEVSPIEIDLPKHRELANSEDFSMAELDPKHQKNFKNICKHLNIEETEFSYMDLVGSRVEVTWTKAQGAPGKWSGEIIDFEPKLYKYWIRYDIEEVFPSGNADYHQLEISVTLFNFSEEKLKNEGGWSRKNGGFSAQLV